VHCNTPKRQQKYIWLRSVSELIYADFIYVKRVLLFGGAKLNLFM
jgi:hypothetical protein